MSGTEASTPKVYYGESSTRLSQIELGENNSITLQYYEQKKKPMQSLWDALNSPVDGEWKTRTITIAPESYECVAALKAAFPDEKNKRQAGHIEVTFKGEHLSFVKIDRDTIGGHALDEKIKKNLRTKPMIEGTFFAGREIDNLIAAQLNSNRGCLGAIANILGTGKRSPTTPDGTARGI